MGSRRPSALSLTLIAFLLPEVGHLAQGFSQGAPDNACKNMSPQHQTEAQPTTPPYNISVSATEIAPGQTVTVTISGDQAFMGFMAKALSSGFPVGSLKALDSSSKVICNDLSVTHSTPLPKKSVSFEWAAPDDLPEGTSINFKATVVQQRVVYWENVLSMQRVYVKLTTAPPAGSHDHQSHDHQRHQHGREPSLTPVKSKSTLPLDRECGKSKACFHDCKNGHCTFIVSWEDKADDVAFHFIYKLPNGNKHWIALGFSHDHNMGDDSVTECIMSDDDEVKVQQSFNTGLFNNYIDNKQAALSAESGKVADGVMHCHFNRRKQYQLDERVFDLTKEYYLMVAVGEAIKGNKLPHAFDVLPDVSAHKINLHSVADIGRKEHTMSPLIQAHGALMIIAWVLLVSVGVTSARYGKLIWPKCNLFGANIWFQLHRVCMALTVTLTAVAVLLMFIQCRGYCQIPKLPGKSHWPIHPPLGILVFLLSLANPIMAVFRPAPSAPSRYIFNWSHWGVGVLSWILSALTIFIGLDLERAKAPPEAMQVLLAYGIYHILFLVAMETLPRPVRKFYDALAERTVQRGRMYNLERAQQENVGYMAEDGDVDVLSRQASYNSIHAPDTAGIHKDEEKGGKTLTRDELKVQKIILLCHYCFVSVFTFCLLLVVYLYTPLVVGDHHGG